MLRATIGEHLSTFATSAAATFGRPDINQSENARLLTAWLSLRIRQTSAVLTPAYRREWKSWCPRKTTQRFGGFHSRTIRRELARLSLQVTQRSYLLHQKQTLPIRHSAIFLSKPSLFQRRTQFWPDDANVQLMKNSFGAFM